MFAFLKMNQPRKIIETEIRESELALLQAHSNKEHWEAEINKHNAKLKRLRNSWNAMQKEEAESKDSVRTSFDTHISSIERTKPK